MIHMQFKVPPKISNCPPVGLTPHVENYWSKPTMLVKSDILLYTYKIAMVVHYFFKKLGKISYV